VCLVLHTLTFFSTDFNAKRKKKVAEIYQALNSDPTDVAALRRMAISEGGLLNDEIRRKVWPKLLNVNTSDPPPESGKGGGSLSRRQGEKIPKAWIFFALFFFFLDFRALFYNMEDHAFAHPPFFAHFELRVDE
jgi:hypothetical protein